MRRACACGERRAADQNCFRSARLLRTTSKSKPHTNLSSQTSANRPRQSHIAHLHLMLRHLFTTATPSARLACPISTATLKRQITRTSTWPLTVRQAYPYPLNKLRLTNPNAEQTLITNPSRSPLLQHTLNRIRNLTTPLQLTLPPLLRQTCVLPTPRRSRRRHLQPLQTKAAMAPRHVEALAETPVPAGAEVPSARGAEVCPA